MTTYEQYCRLRVKCGYDADHAMIQSVWEGCDADAQENMLIQLRRAAARVRTSRYFTRNCLELHFPNDCSHIEVTDDGRYMHVRDDGSSFQNIDITVPALDACLRYVENGQWVEIDAQRRPILPTSAYIGGDHW